ncbi:MAG: B12-binding domain-containing radical SAM protein [Thermodesulfobacteriota bacterium]
MKILLVKPYPELAVARRLSEAFLHLEPLELEIVAGGIDPEHQVKILDLSVEKSPLKVFDQTIDTYRPDTIGFTGYSSTAHIVKELARRAKNALDNVFIIVGGIHATIYPGDYDTPHMDAVVRGEGATAMSRLLDRLKQGRMVHDGVNILEPSHPDFSSAAMSSPPPYAQIKEIPSPRRDLVDRSRYFCIWTHSDTGRLDTIFPRVASLRTSLGCPFSCSFCVIPFAMNKAYLQRDPEDVVDEIRQLEQDYIYFVDDEMFINMKRVTRIAELLKERNIKKKYISWARSDTIVRHPEVFRIWKEAGLDVVYVGLESMNEEKLDAYNKKTSFETNREAVRIIQELGITLHAAFIVDPDFTKEDFRRLEKDIKELGSAEITFTVLSPSPGTELFRKNSGNFICDPFRFYDCMHSVLPTNLPLKKFYQHFGRLYSLALRANPLRMRKIKIPAKDLFYAVSLGTRYIFSLYRIYKDYPKPMQKQSGEALVKTARSEGFSNHDR